MKKWLITLLFSFIIINSVQAACTYKVYNPKENKSHVVTLGTMGVLPKQYIFVFFKGMAPYCVIGAKEDVKNGLVGGQCTDANAFMRVLKDDADISILKNYQFGWRELSEDTYYREVQEIIEDREENGLRLFGSD